MEYKNVRCKHLRFFLQKSLSNSDEMETLQAYGTEWYQKQKMETTEPNLKEYTGLLYSVCLHVEAVIAGGMVEPMLNKSYR